jgi:hypothetical protein
VYLDADLMKTYYGKESPPPGSYNVPSAVGKQVDRARGAGGAGPRVLWGGLGAPLSAVGFRPLISNAFLLTAGRLAHPVNRQVNSTKESAPGIKIGTGLRSLDYQVMR